MTEVDQIRQNRLKWTETDRIGLNAKKRNTEKRIDVLCTIKLKNNDFEFSSHLATITNYKFISSHYYDINYLYLCVSTICVILFYFFIIFIIIIIFLTIAIFNKGKIQCWVYCNSAHPMK